MNTKQHPCSTELIEQFLDDRLSASEVADFENHLNSCATCRRDLEARVADESWWSQARDCLAAGGLSSTELGSAKSSRPREAGNDTSWLISAIKPFLAPTDDPRMMGRVGPYEIVGVIGSGGNGIVLKGFDAALNRYVAIKLVSPRLADSGSARRRFSREAQAAAAVVHENVMAIHAVAETQGLPYLVMPYVRGASLEKRIQSEGQLALEEILRVGMQVAAGLAAAHAQGLVHRDIKPANILLEEGIERVKITDFGLARAADDASLTRSGVIAGTPQYMSPEQARGEPVDHRTDLFSLGCVLYAACTGHSPFRAETSYGVLRKICESEPRDVRVLNPAIPAWLGRIVSRLLAKELPQRYCSAAEVAALLESCLAHVQQPTTVDLPSELVEPKSGWLPAAWSAHIGRGRLMIAAASLLVGVGLLTVAWLGSPRNARESDENPAERSEEPLAGPADTVGDRSEQRRDRPEQTGLTSVWNDGTREQIDGLAAAIEQLGVDCADDLWNDSVATRIEQLESDIEDLGGDVSGGEPHESVSP
jgi:serine/threonine protein kinase